MGIFDRFKRKPPPREFFPGSEAEFDDGFADVITRFVTRLTSADPIIEDMGPVVVVRSPVLVVRDGALHQPASLIPRGMLTRFWEEPARTYVDATATASLAAVYAGYFARQDDDSWARECLSDTEDIYVSDEAPLMAWPDTDLRLRAASLLIADLARKLASGYEPEHIRSVYGGESSADTDSCFEAMKSEEETWYTSSLVGSA